MKIKVKEGNKIELDIINRGDVFIFNEDYYLKTDEYTSISIDSDNIKVVRLNDGKLDAFPKNIKVELVDGYFQLD